MTSKERVSSTNWTCTPRARRRRPNQTHPSTSSLALLVARCSARQCSAAGEAAASLGVWSYRQGLNGPASSLASIISPSGVSPLAGLLGEARLPLFFYTAACRSPRLPHAHTPERRSTFRSAHTSTCPSPPRRHRRYSARVLAATPPRRTAPPTTPLPFDGHCRAFHSLCGRIKY